MLLTEKDIKKFQKKILSYYNKEGRDLPWRKTKNPYHILVSEIMLQQTQVDRVIPKYKTWIKKFPTVSTLAQASFKEVLLYWQGLGYNRRAKFLQAAAQKISTVYKGRLPQTIDHLKTLPGIGPATAASISAFAFNQPTVFLETNIRSVLIREFFPEQDLVDDQELYPVAEQVLYRKDPRRWYNALMDYGTLLKQTENHSRRSKTYTKQSKFSGSDREIRGKILKLLLQQNYSEKKLLQSINKEPSRIKKIIQQLRTEGFIAEQPKKTYSIVI
jgi:A/G-specific adenine glycosylase